MQEYTDKEKIVCDRREFMGFILEVGALIIASFLGVLLVKAVEKHRQEKLGMGEIKFYVAIPIGIVILIELFIMSIVK